MSSAATAWRTLAARADRDPTLKAVARVFLRRGRPPPADLGLFGPSSMTWRIHADPSSFLGGGRALLIQALHPTVMGLFEQNTHYRQDPWGRLFRTSAFFVEATYGDVATARRAGAHVRAVHARIRGIDPVTGCERWAGEPELLRWVHTTAVHSFVHGYRRYGGLLSPAKADSYAAEMVRTAELVGLPAEETPASMDEVRRYLRGVTGLTATPAAMEGMRMILFEPPLPRALLPSWRLVSAAVIASLPRHVRRLYGLQWHASADPPVRAVVFALTRVFKWLVPQPWVTRQSFAMARRSPAGSASSGPAHGPE